MILVVAPEPSQRAALASLVPNPGMPVVEAADAHVAFELLRRNRAIRSLVTAADLPVVSGARLVEQALSLRPDLQVTLTHDTSSMGAHQVARSSSGTGAPVEVR